MEKSYNTVDIFGFTVFSDRLDKVPTGNSCILINTISPNSYGISTKDPVFKEALQHTDILVLDGVYFALSSILLNGQNIVKNQGPDVFDYFLKEAARISGRIFFMGSSEKTLQKIKDKIAGEYPSVTVGTYSPPFKPEFSSEDNEAILNEINSFRPDFLFIGLTAPKQEKWAYQHKDKISAKLAISIGGVFDWYAGNEKMIPSIWWKLRMAWLIRTIRRPEILKRYPNIFIFFAHLFLALIGFKKYKYGKI